MRRKFVLLCALGVCFFHGGVCVCSEEPTAFDASVKAALEPAARAADAAADAGAEAGASTARKKGDAVTVADAFDTVAVAPAPEDAVIPAQPEAPREVVPARSAPASVHKDGTTVFGAHLGYLAGETVYDFNNHRSELKFPLDNPIFGAHGHTRIGDAGSLHARMQTTIEDDAGDQMRNRDFDTSGRVTSDTRSDASVRAFIADVWGRYDFHNEPDTLKVGALLGYSYERLDYDVTGLTYAVDEVNGLAGQTRYSGEQVISYLVEYHVPYIGLAIDAEKPGWGMGANIKYSFYPFAWDRDNHVLRGLTFYADYDKNGTGWLGTLYGYWKLRGNWTVRAGADFTVVSIDGVTWEENRNPLWDAPQSTDLRQVAVWSGFEYRF